MVDRAQGWREGFMAMSVLLGEPDERIAHALGEGPRTGLEKDSRARAVRVAAGIAAVVRELDAQRRSPWLE